MSLESLIIVNHSGYLEAVENLVNHLVLQRLRQFHLVHVHIDPSAALSTSFEFLELLSDRSSDISDLKLHLMDFTTTSLTQILPAFPCLEKLRLVLGADGGLWGPPNAGQLLAFLARNPSNRHPALKEFILESEECDDVIWIEFLQMHLDNDTTLRLFHLHLWCDPPDILPDVERFLARGLDVSVRYQPPPQNSNPTPWQGIEDEEEE
jgi:hypothetical protein